MAAKRKVVPTKPAKKIVIEKRVTEFTGTKRGKKASAAGGGTDSTGPRMREDSKKE